ncbi:hypothetical protein JHK85_006596 [Glycine max]|nr:hypothetical protein JHK85_006596 [Glycine max]KAG5071201.1 hypothetical protein JHK86_006412 [Glycine max]
MHNLVQIDLSYNSFTGSIPSSLFTLPSLERIQLSHNKFSHLDEFINVKSSTLEFLDISNNNLSWPFPVSFFQLNLLMHLSISSNKFDWSVLPKIHLVNVTNDDMLPFPNILYLGLASCNLKTIPGFLKNCSTLSSLDLSDNQIQGIVPHWIWKPNILWNLNISHNLLIVLDLSINNISGTIPSCLMMMNGTIEVLNLKNNNLSGPIPDTVPVSCGLWTLNLNGNQLDGPIPKSLAYCSKLEIPIGTQIQTFSASSFEGTDGLDGPPLTKNSDDKKKHEKNENPQSQNHPSILAKTSTKTGLNRYTDHHIFISLHASHSIS